MIKKSPRDAKVALAKHIVTWLHDADAAEAGHQDFITKFVKKETPDEMPEFEVKESEMNICTIVVDTASFAPSTSEARRLIQQGGVTVDNVKIIDPNHFVSFDKKDKILKVGKRKFAKIRRKK
jgi:tyrosyl-tRNA synthetase